ncbi:uncharacterized protein VNE69_12087 [Vairimorpha necatrix]|uniref:Uncharacterized protein n=1 Tax=Vairimorpha necatrix TaxID=6039 RepID=A0AAX4JGT4_9MICR
MSDNESSTEFVEIPTAVELHHYVDGKSCKKCNGEPRKNEDGDSKENCKISFNLINPTEGQNMDEKNSTVLLKPRFKAYIKTSERTGTEQENYHRSILVGLFMNQSLEYLKDTLIENRSCIKDLLDIVKYNLTKSCQDDCNNFGLYYSQLFIFMSYFEKYGIEGLDILIDSFKKPGNKEKFIKNVIEKCYYETKDQVRKLLKK